MKLFIDGEWNSYKGDLISLALVSECGKVFTNHLVAKTLIRGLLPTSCSTLQTNPQSRCNQCRSN